MFPLFHFAEGLFFYHKLVMDFVKNFYASIDMIMFLSSHLFMCYIMLIDLQILYHPYIPGTNIT